MAADKFSLPLNEKRYEDEQRRYEDEHGVDNCGAMPLPDLMHLIAEHDVEPDDPDSDMFLRRLHHQSVSFAADMIASATVSDRQITIETTTNRTYTYTY